MLGGRKAQRLKSDPYAFKLCVNAFQPYSFLASWPLVGRWGQEARMLGGRKARKLKSHPFAFSLQFPASQPYGLPASWPFCKYRHGGIGLQCGL